MEDKKIEAAHLVAATQEVDATTGPLSGDKVGSAAPMSHRIGATVGSVAFAVAGSMAMMPALAPALEADAQAPAAIESPITAGSERQATVGGVFLASQDVVTPNSWIAHIFRDNPVVKCVGLPTYGVSELSDTVSVGGPAARSSFDATVGQMAEESDGAQMIMGCACAGNTAGGPAIVNAQVSGVLISAVAQMAGAL